MIREALTDYFGNAPEKVEPVGGGDIGAAFRVRYKGVDYFCKLYQGDYGAAMAMAEKQGLAALANTNTLAVPEVHACLEVNKGGLLILEYIHSISPSDASMEKFGRQLAEMHEQPGDRFGWPTDNFIGRLVQVNSPGTSWPEFYCENRLKPQYQKARSLGLLAPDEVPGDDKLLRTLQSFCENISPSLVHGDLWSGNYMIGRNGKPYLIDPAAYVGDALVDLAMARLFGGFSPAFFSAYQELRREQPYQSERIELYQLYFLLVHLNLFGRSYRDSVLRISRRYFR